MATWAFAPAAFAQGNSVINGTLSDALDGKALSDVVVTAVSPALQGEEVVVSDATRQYRVSQLRPGTYTLRFEKEGFKPFTRSEIVLRIDHTVRVNISLQPDSVSDEFLVTAAAPVVDVNSTTTGIAVDQSFIRGVAF